MGYSEPSQVREVREALYLMQQHPNYKEPTPLPGESLIEFTLRSASHLVSPPQEEGESYELECIEIAAAILTLKDTIKSAWDEAESARITQPTQ